MCREFYASMDEEKSAPDEKRGITKDVKKSFSLETDLRKFITKNPPSAHKGACKEYGMIGICSTVEKVRLMK